MSDLESGLPERRSTGSQMQRFLSEAGRTLAASLDHDETVASVLSLAVPTLADWAILLLEPSCAERVRTAVKHVSSSNEERLRDEIERHVAATTEGQGAQNSYLSGERILIEQCDPANLQSVMTPEHIALQRSIETTSLVATPLEVRGDRIGVIVLGIAASNRRFGDIALVTIEDFANRAATALDNARNYREARDAETRLRQHAERLEVLASASEAFAMARLDLDTVLNTITRHVAELLGDVCSLRLISDDGEMNIPVAFHHTNPEAFEMFRTMTSFGPRPVYSGTVGQVIRTGEPLLITNQTLEDWRPIVLPDWIPYIERFGMHSILIVPMRVAGTTIGTLGLWRESTSAVFTLDDQHFLQDLADRASLAVDNARLYSRAQAAIQSRDEFLSVAAHELKTPVTSLRGYAQLLMRQFDRSVDIHPDRLRGALASIDRQTSRLSALISQLLDTSRIQSGELNIERTPTDVAVLIADLVEHAQTLSEIHTITVQVEPNLTADLDSLRIEQVLTNLLENAIKYSPAGCEITITANRQSNNDLQIAVEDRGPGIPESEQERIFERFYQFNASGRTSGIGLGLYVSRQIVALHGGTLFVESPASGGARFVMRIPPVIEPVDSLQI